MSTHRILVTPSAAVTLTPTADALGRLNPGSQRLRHWRVIVPAGVNGGRGTALLEVSAVPYTSAIPFLDVDLGGYLFQWSWGVSAGAPPPIVLGAESSLASVTFDERHAGLWRLTCWRNRAGASVLPLEVALG